MDERMICVLGKSAVRQELAGRHRRIGIASVPHAESIPLSALCAIYRIGQDGWESEHNLHGAGADPSLR